MEDRFFVAEMCIGVLEKKGNFFQLNPNYLIKKCVVDEQNNIAVDMETKLKYDYIKTVNGKYFLDNSQEKIELNKKIAIFPIKFILSSSENFYANLIIDELKNGKNFEDGNKVINTDENLKFSFLKKIKFNKNHKK